MKWCPTCKHRGDLPELLQKMGNMEYGVEVGVQAGAFANVLLSHPLASTIKHLHGVDLWEPYSEYTEVMDHKANFDETIRITELHSPKFIIMRRSSIEAAEVFHRLKKRVDFVYIDANHAADFVRRDLEIWSFVLREGGVLAGHDIFHLEYPDVTEEVVRFASSKCWPINLIPGSLDNCCVDGQVPSFYMVKK